MQKKRPSGTRKAIAITLLIIGAMGCFSIAVMMGRVEGIGISALSSPLIMAVVGMLLLPRKTTPAGPRRSSGSWEGWTATPT